MENLNTDVNRSNLMALLNFCTIFTALILVIRIIIFFYIQITPYKAS